MRLQERSIALAKELAALKLYVEHFKAEANCFSICSLFAYPAQYVNFLLVFRVSDLDLDEEEVLKLASLGKETNNKETIDVLKKSLVIRNKYVILN